jgi:hypothetical protein
MSCLPLSSLAKFQIRGAHLKRTPGHRPACPGIRAIQFLVIALLFLNERVEQATNGTKDDTSDDGSTKG